MTALFEDIIFGPIRSRRLGLSLGVNLLPRHAKICNFDCIYCECGSNSERRGELSERRFAAKEDVEIHLQEVLCRMKSEGELPDVITFAGNGEPTLHPDFEEIVDIAIRLRDEHAPEAKISVLSNATTLAKESVVRALHRVDNNILKLDSAINDKALQLNRPTFDYKVDRVIELMSQFEGEAIVQTMFLRGSVDGRAVDNLDEDYLASWLEALQRIKPRQVMIYSLDRDTPCLGLERISREELQAIAQRVEHKLGVKCLFT